ncbi:MAG: UDP-glucose/GDP-mannose dehydrogenase family protein [Muribaculaceae bacterium]|nr:UDP-glucose/GDP-mannose dehydrogenase family protein [Muribaculaceae bacterium]
MKIAIVGTGYVGLVTGACFAEMGVDVTCVDIDAAKIDGLRQGIIPIYEPGLEALVRRNTAEGRLHFTTSLGTIGGDDCPSIVFCAVGTPPDDDGSADLRNVLAVAAEFGRNLQGYALLVTKSTVPVGTHRLVRRAVEAELEARGCTDMPFDLAANPEFLKEGAAIKDFMSPDRVVIGTDSPHARTLMERLYRPFLLNNFRVMFMDLASAEMAKYAANAMLATRISFINEIADLCEKVGADVSAVRSAIGADARIGNKFLYPGCGYGGSCFPKDVRALIVTGEQNGCPMQVVRAVEDVNERQKTVVFRKLAAIFGDDLRGRRIALWGLAFKPETDDMRCAPSLEVIRLLIEAGAEVTVYDPVAMDECRRRMGDTVQYAADMYAACEGADALALLTEWKLFRLPSWPRVAALMRGADVVDGRNIYNSTDLGACGLRLYSIGRPDAASCSVNATTDSSNTL